MRSHAVGHRVNSSMNEAGMGMIDVDGLLRIGDCHKL